MPKMKSHRGAAKRLRLTGTGKFVRKGVGARHLLEHKSGERKRRLQRNETIAPADLGRARKLLGK
jgi:large subunit ribosomal protein L35